MNLERIVGMAAAGESETLEFKSTTGARREAARTICAMLNQDGGHVLFGVLPDGKVVGQHVSERTIEQVTAELARIDPPAFPAIEGTRVHEAREMVAISVSRGQAGPFMYRGSAYRRVGNTTVEMRADEYRRMLYERMHSERRWENQPADEWSVDDLDANEIRTTVEESRPCSARPASSAGPPPGPSEGDAHDLAHHALPGRRRALARLRGPCAQPRRGEAEPRRSPRRLPVDASLARQETFHEPHRRRDSDLERLYAFVRNLLAKLPPPGDGQAFVLDDEVALRFFRLQQMKEGSIDLSEGEADPLKGPTDVGTARAKDEEVTLSSLIDRLNERFGTDFTEADQLFFDQIRASAENDENIAEAARANNFANFASYLDRMLDELFIARMEGNEEIFSRVMTDTEFRSAAHEHLAREIFRRVREEQGAGGEFLNGGLN